MKKLLMVVVAAMACSGFAAPGEGIYYSYTNEVARTSPDWLKYGVIYQIQPRSFTPEGTIKAAETKLPWLKELGVTICYLTPVFVADDDMRQEMWSPRQHKSGFNTPKNPYRMKDYYNIDPEYGTKEDLKAFVKTAHALGIRVMLDVVFLHCGPGAVFLKDHPEYFAYDKNGKMIMAGWKFPKLNFANRGLRRYLKTNLLYWVAETNVDGFRCDVADGVPLDFWEDVRGELEELRPDIALLAEGCKAANTRSAFDANYNWPICWKLREILKMYKGCGGGTLPPPYETKASAIEAKWKAHYANFPRGTFDMNFTENHDTRNDCYEDTPEKVFGPDHQLLGLATCYAMRGIPLIYNGQEICDERRHSIWGKIGIDWTKAETPKAKARFAMLRKLGDLRRTNKAFQAGEMVWHKNSNPDAVLSFARRAAGEKDVVFVANFTADAVAVTVEDLAPDAKTLLSNCGKVANGSVALEPWGFVIVE